MRAKLGALGCVAFAGVFVVAPQAHADIAGVGQPVRYQGTNSPNTFNVTPSAGLTLGTTSIDGGLLDVTFSVVPISGGGEWDIFKYQTASGPLASTASAAWSLYETYYITTPAVWKGFFIGWGTNGSLISPTSIGGSDLPLETNPITGSGLVFGQSYNTPVSDFVQFYGYLTSWNALSSSGFNPSNINTVEMAIEFKPSAVPEPTSLLLFGTALAGLGLTRRKRR